MELALATTLVMEPAVEEAVTLSKTLEPTGTGFGDAEAAVMLIAVTSGVKTAAAKLFFWFPLQVAVKVTVPPLNPEM